ncbi:MAG: hypothetical protein EOO16_12870 [Chitinophagaceae bacterium]|nr:MAG: hypothetical protein EOO16_12870 [Chitinophagaceae bacterium]
MKKPINAKTHGIMDYVLTGVQAATPAVLKMNSTAVKTYAGLSLGYAVINALTDTPVGLKKQLSFKAHEKADLGLLAGLGLMTFLPFIRKEKKVLAFHLGFLAIGVVQFLLTDYSSRR